MVWEGELKFTKRIVGEVDCFGPVVMNRFTPQLVKNGEIRGFEKTEKPLSSGQK